MSRASTRQPHKNMYKACTECLQNVSYFGLCNAGYDNFYQRKGKNNKCPKCQPEIRKMKNSINTTISYGYEESLKDVGMSNKDFYKELEW